MLDLTRQLIGIPSRAADDNSIYDWCDAWFRERSLDSFGPSIVSPLMTHQPHENVYLRVGSGSGPRIMLNAHLDTVDLHPGWTRDPFGDDEEEEDRIYGLGSADMKGGCAAAIMATHALLERMPDLQGELFLSLVFGEEAPHSLGTDLLLREMDLSDFDLVLLTEPSPLVAINDYCLTCRRMHREPPFPVPVVGFEGRILFEIEFFGTSSHASHPSRGVNAIDAAARFIQRLQDFEVFSSIKMGRGHYAVIGIEGGGQSFTIPDYCKVRVNRQLVVGETEKKTRLELRKLISSLKLPTRVSIQKRPSPSPDVEYYPYLFENSAFIDRFMELMPRNRRGKKCRLTSSSVGDNNLFAARTRVPTLVCGPGGGNIHAPDEFVFKHQVVETADILLTYLLREFGG